MKRLSALVTIAVYGLSAGSVPSRGWHMELSDGNVGWVIVVNDSEKTIDGFHVRGRCGGGGTETSQDDLSFNGTMMSHPALSHQDGRPEFQAGFIRPGERMFSNIRLMPQPAGCQWDAEVDAVLYRDGTYEGDEQVARGLQARRDGMLAAVQFWSERFHGGLADGVSATADAERLAQTDHQKTMFPGCHTHPIECEYWRGVNHVDLAMATVGKRKTSSPEETYDRMIAEVDRWQKKIDADPACRKLDATFPLPEELVGQSALQARMVAAPAHPPQ